MQWSLTKSSIIFSLSSRALTSNGSLSSRWGAEPPPCRMNRNSSRTFLYSILAKSAFSDFLSYFLKLATPFTTSPKPVKVDNGVQGDGPSNRRRDDGFARHNVPALQVAKKFGVAPMFLVAGGKQFFQHLDGLFRELRFDVVEV